jgi:hypothetical protein
MEAHQTVNKSHHSILSGKSHDNTCWEAERYRQTDRQICTSVWGGGGQVNTARVYINTLKCKPSVKMTCGSVFVPAARSNSVHSTTGILYFTFDSDHANHYERKAVPLRHAGDKGQNKYRSYSFLTSALDGSEWSASRSG